MIKNLPAMQEMWADVSSIPGSGRYPGKKPTPAFLPRKSQSMGLQKNWTQLGNLTTTMLLGIFMNEFLCEHMFSITWEHT